MGACQGANSAKIEEHNKEPVYIYLYTFKVVEEITRVD